MNYRQLFLTIIFIFIALFSTRAFATLSGQTIQIRTHFQDLIGKPTWLLILRDVDSGHVYPYLFDVRQKDNVWVAFANSRVYRVTASQLKFSSFAVINNFCHIQDELMDGKSLVITVTGHLSPDSSQLHCRVLRYNDVPFPIANEENNS